MNQRYRSNTTASIGIADVFLVVFVVLKLTGVIDWSWWWVLSPLWIAIGLFVVIAAGISIVYKVKRPRKRKRDKQ